MPSLKRTRLTRAAVEALKPTSKAYRVWDAEQPGLCLRVLPSGRRTWEVHWDRNRALAFGTYPTITIEGARIRARARLVEADELGAPKDVIAARVVEPNITTIGGLVEKRYEKHLLTTTKSGRATISNLRAQFGRWFDRRLDSITTNDWDDFKAERLAAGVHPATVNRDMDRLKALLSQAVAWKLLEVNPLRGVKRIKRGIDEAGRERNVESRVRYLTKPEEKALRAALAARDTRAAGKRESGNAWRAARGREAMPPITDYADHLTPMVLIAMNTGLRRGELTQLVPADLDFGLKQITVRAGYAKSGKDRRIPMNTEVVAILKKVLKRHEGKGRIFDVAAVTKSWAGVVTAAKLSDLRFHDTRHHFASKLVMAGVDLNTVRELLGHSDIKTTLIYAHLAPEHKRAAVQLLVKG